MAYVRRGIGQTTSCGTTPVVPTCPAGYSPALQGTCNYSCIQNSAATNTGNFLNWPSTLLFTLFPNLNSGGGFGALPVLAAADLAGWGAVAYFLFGGGR
jgi:hypothetical protein